MRAPVLRRPRSERELLAKPIAEKFDGVAHRRDLRAAGITYSDIRGEIEAGRWHRLGRHTVGIGSAEMSERAKRAHAVWESGGGAALQGVEGLRAAGLVGYEEAVIDVALPMNNRRHDVEGVRRTHYAQMPPVISSSVPRVQPEFALIFAMQKAVSDRAAALLLCMAVQQRIVATGRLLEVFHSWGRCRRRALIRAIIKDVCSGAHSLGELDFADLCRRFGLPPPTRQAVRTGANGRVYLDVAWEDIGLVIEIDGGHHATALNPVLDALRQNKCRPRRGDGPARAGARTPPLRGRVHEPGRARIRPQECRAPLTDRGIGTCEWCGRWSDVSGQWDAAGLAQVGGRPVE